MDELPVGSELPEDDLVAMMHAACNNATTASCGWDAITATQPDTRAALLSMCARAANIIGGIYSFSADDTRQVWRYDGDPSVRPWVYRRVE